MPDIVVVTGAAQGLGRAIADRFIKGGSTVVGLDLRLPEGSAFDVLGVDITEHEAVTAAFAQIEETYGKVTVCVNAAGVYPRSTVATFSVADYHLMFDVNVLGTWLVSTAFADHAAPRGILLNISSVDGISPEPKSLLYSASKAAVINLTSGVADEFAAKGLRVVGVAPGYIATDTVRAIAGTLAPDAAEPKDVAEVVWRLTADGGIPLVSGETIIARARMVLDN